MRKFILLILFIACGLNITAQADSTFQKAIKDKTLHKGIINVYEDGKTYYFEVPADLFQRDFIWFAELKGSPLTEGILASATSPAQTFPTMICQLEQHGSQVFLRDYTSPLALRSGSVQAAADRLRMEKGLREGNVPPILLAFPVAGYGPDSSVLINVTDVMAKNHPFFDVKTIFPGLTIQDPKRSYIGAVESFPTNLRITSVYTFDVNNQAAGALADIMGKINSTSGTIELQHSLSMLPEKPMPARLLDPRLGYFRISFKELVYEGGYEKKSYINRYRLEKKDPDAAISEPVKPIVYFIGPNVPERYRQLFKEAVESWNIAFAEAGFRNAILARDPPDDPSWSPNDLGHSVIRWINRPIANAIGPVNVDPRSGEILSAHVLIWEDVISLAEKWYYLQGSGSDPRARQFPMPEGIRDSLIKYVVAHEVGHTLGLLHNHRASQAYTTAQLRDPEFANANGPVASIMSYGRINYIAQPGDGVTRLIPKIGPYDLLAIKYGYMPIPGASSPEDEVPTLNRWLEVQRANPILLYGGEDTPSQHDPMVLTENIGKDRIEAYELGMKNLQRAVDHLPSAIGQSPQDIPALKKYYTDALEERITWLKAAAKELSGVVEKRTLRLDDDQFVPVSDERKRQVTKFLISQLEEESHLFTPVMRRLYPPYELTPMIVESQTTIVDLLMNPVVANSFLEHSLGKDQYAYSNYLMDVHGGIFGELARKQHVIPPLRREIQRHFFRSLVKMAVPSEKSPPPRIATAAARLVLHELKPMLERAVPDAGNAETRAHLLDLLMQAKEVMGEE